LNIDKNVFSSKLKIMLCFLKIYQKSCLRKEDNTYLVITYLHQ